MSPSNSTGAGLLVSPTPKLTFTGPAVKSLPAAAVFPVNTTSTDVATPVWTERVTMTTLVVFVLSPSVAENVAAEKSYCGGSTVNTTSLPSPPR